MVRYLAEERRRSDSYVSEDSTVDRLHETPRRGLTQTESALMFRKADEDDADRLTHLYKHVFLTYPTPVFNPLYIKKNNERKHHLLCRIRSGSSHWGGKRRYQFSIGAR